MPAAERCVGTRDFVIFILPLDETLEPARALCFSRKSFSNSSALLPLGRFGGPLLAPFSFELVRPIQFVVHGDASRPLGLGRGDDLRSPSHTCLQRLGSRASSIGLI